MLNATRALYLFSRLSTIVQPTRIVKSFSTSPSSLASKMPLSSPSDVLSFWFGPDYATAPRSASFKAQFNMWFNGGEAADLEIRSRFGHLVDAAASGDLDAWTDPTAPITTNLAAIIVMDQFSRNVHRGTPQAFALDAKCAGLVHDLIKSGRYRELKPMEYEFVALPLMHQETMEDQELCIKVLQEAMEIAMGLEGGEELVTLLEKCVNYGFMHKEVIEKWGRFPHRNEILGRESTEAEKKGLEDGSISKF